MFCLPREERVVIGYVLSGKPSSDLRTFQPQISCDWFTTESSRLVWQEIQSLERRGENANNLSVFQSLDAKGLLNKAGGAASITPGNDAWSVVENCLTKLQKAFISRESARLCKDCMDGKISGSETGKRLLSLEPSVSSPKIDLEVTPPILSDDALYGIAGQIVRKIEPETEAHPAALLLQLLTGIGSLIGRGPHFRTGPDEHHANLYTAIVGDSSRGRKGTSWGYIRNILKEIDPTWSISRVKSGLASGEGIVHELKDPEDGTAKDKRLLITETELAHALNAMNRNGSTLSTTLRNGWDSGFLANMSKGEPGTASDCHISLIGHITRHEIRELLTNNDAANGFANRWLWVHSSRTKLLPRGGESLDFSEEIKTLDVGVVEARRLGPLQRSPEAEDYWVSIYPELTREDIGGHWGKATSRAEAQVVRLSLLFALLDFSERINLNHLKSAKALWDYCFQSARWVFEESAYSRDTLKILNRLEKGPMSLTNISKDCFQGHRKAGDIERALSELDAVIKRETLETGGRSVSIISLKECE